LKNGKPEEEKFTFTPPSKKEEDAFHAKLHKEMEEKNKNKNSPDATIDIMSNDNPMAMMDAMMG
tara:strand:- start:85 stop:276 length:192 start_codon:yes stop_codon:yes gene_type:complete